MQAIQTKKEESLYKAASTVDKSRVPILAMPMPFDNQINETFPREPRNETTARFAANGGSHERRDSLGLPPCSPVRLVLPSDRFSRQTGSPVRPVLPSDRFSRQTGLPSTLYHFRQRAP